MSRDRLRELMKKHKEGRNDRVQKRNIENNISEFEHLNIAPTPKPNISDPANFRLVLQQALQDNNTPNLKRNPFTPLVMPDKLNSTINEESILLSSLDNNQESTSQTPQIPQTPQTIVPQTPKPVMIPQTPQTIVPQTPKPVMIPQTPQTVVPQTPKPVMVPQTPQTIVPQTSQTVVPQTPKPIVPQTPQTVMIPQTPKPIVPQTPQTVMVPQTPKPIVPQTPQTVMIPQTPQPVMIPQTPKPIVPQTPQTVVPQTPKPIVPQTPQTVVPQTPKSVMVPQTVVPQTPKPVMIPQTPQPVVTQTPKAGLKYSEILELNKGEVKNEVEKVEKKREDESSAYKDISNIESKTEQSISVKKEKTNNKTMWINLIKKSNCQALSSDVIEGCKDLTEEIIKELCENIVQKGKTDVSVEEIKEYIDKNIKNKETEISVECVFPPSIFMSMISDVLKSFGCSICPECVYVLQTFVESLLVKMLNGAELVREASKRKRVFATDLLISYQIHKM
jgi:hypothetical protein